MKTLKIFVLVFLGLGMLNLAWAQNYQNQQMPMRHMQGMMGQGMMNMNNLGNPTLYLNYAEELELSDNQISRLKEVRMNALKETSDERSSLQVAYLELQDLLDTENINIGNVENKVREIHDLQAGIQIQSIRANLNARNILTQTQREQTKDLLHMDEDTMMNTNPPAQRGRMGRGMMR